MTTDERHTLGLQIVVVVLLVLMNALAVVTRHPQWFDHPAGEGRHAERAMGMEGRATDDHQRH